MASAPNPFLARRNHPLLLLLTVLPQLLVQLLLPLRLLLLRLLRLLLLRLLLIRLLLMRGRSCLSVEISTSVAPSTAGRREDFLATLMCWRGSMDVTMLKELTSRQAGLVSWRQMSAAGMPPHRLRSLLKRGTLRRYVRAVYLVVDVAPQGFDAERSRAAWAGLLAADPYGIASGACALHLHGVQGLPQRIVPEVIVPMRHSGRGPTGVKFRRVAAEFEWLEVSGRKIAAPIPALVQSLPGFEPRRAVAVLDSALNRGVVDASALEVVRKRLRGQRGVAALADYWSLVDGRAASPVETAVRLECTFAGIPPTAVQVVLRDEWKNFVARGDFGWRRRDGTWVLVEVDGVPIHSRPEALFHDRERQNRIMLTGRHTTLRFTARDVGTGRVVTQIRTALQV